MADTVFMMSMIKVTMTMVGTMMMMMMMAMTIVMLTTVMMLMVLVMVMMMMIFIVAKRDTMRVSVVSNRCLLFLYYCYASGQPQTLGFRSG